MTIVIQNYVKSVQPNIGGRSYPNQHAWLKLCIASRDGIPVLLLEAPDEDMVSRKCYLSERYSVHPI